MGRSKSGDGLPVERAYSAGGVVLRHSERGAELVLGRRRHDGRHTIWSLPKGTPDGDETPEETAMREVREETGLRVRILDTIGDIHYRFVRDGRRIDKTVHYYLMEAIGGVAEGVRDWRSGHERQVLEELTGLDLSAWPTYGAPGTRGDS